MAAFGMEILTLPVDLAPIFDGHLLVTKPYDFILSQCYR